MRAFTQRNIWINENDNPVTSDVFDSTEIADPDTTADDLAYEWEEWDENDNVMEEDVVNFFGMSDAEVKLAAEVYYSSRAVDKRKPPTILPHTFNCENLRCPKIRKNEEEHVGKQNYHTALVYNSNKTWQKERIKHLGQYGLLLN